MSRVEFDPFKGQQFAVQLRHLRGVESIHLFQTWLPDRPIFFAQVGVMRQKDQKVLAVPKPIKVVELVKHGNPPVLEEASVLKEFFLKGGIAVQGNSRSEWRKCRSNWLRGFCPSFFDEFADADPQGQRSNHGRRGIEGKPSSCVERWIMYLSQAVDEIRDTLVQHRLSGRTNLWSTILEQIAKQNSFDGKYADTILEAIRAFLKPLDDKAIISLWRETETGMCDDTVDERLFPECCRMDLEMEILHQTTELAWWEAEQLKPKSKRKKRRPEMEDD